eukprot:TRINITY_DN27984_c0_g1_i3.p1 TRINITY_DN27984_c0_g1~~TRINITY_DN27984_c0_g1_i3.p1  ORF type:complete len:510 (-),score=68.13 TRINITY_DN27984_c0_g1_i3:459-1988(-)
MNLKQSLQLFLFFAASTYLYTWAEDFQCPAILDVDVLILGAGISGIAAAQKLQESGISNFLIIEGTDRIGGRMRHTQLGNVTINLGDNWISGVDSTGESPKENPIWTLKQKCGLQVALTEEDFIFYNKQGNTMDGEEFLLGRMKWFEAVDKIYSMSIAMPSLPEGVSTEGFEVINGDINVQDALKLAGWIPQTETDALVQYLGFDLTYAEKPQVSGLKNYKTDWNTLAGEFGDEQFYVNDQRGYDYIVQCIADDFLNETDPRLLLNTPVKKIYWKDECVCVDVEFPTGGTERACGRYAITTFSSGVLHDSVFSENPFVEIQPPLPQWKKDAVSQSNMVHYHTIFVQFDYIFWDDHEFIARAAFKTDEPQTWPIFQPLGLSNGKFSPDIPLDAPILWATVTGDEARRLDKLTEQEVTEELMVVLRTMYGDDIPYPNKIATQNWLSDPFFRGTWANPKVGSGIENMELLRVPVGAMFFSGEHTSTRYPGYTHGAYLEGQSVAQEVAFLIKT